MPRRWTSEQRAALAQAIQRWKPWEASTGPRSLAGKLTASRNAYKGGQRQQMQWLRAALREQADALRNFRGV